MKLNPESLVVASFETSQPAAAALPTTIGPYDPTRMTYCYWCPPQTIDCPIYTGPAEPIPGTISVVG